MMIINISAYVSVNQILAVVVCYFDLEKVNVADALFDCIFVADETASRFFRGIKSLRHKKVSLLPTKLDLVVIIV